VKKETNAEKIPNNYRGSASSSGRRSGGKIKGERLRNRKGVGRRQKNVPSEKKRGLIRKRESIGKKIKTQGRWWKRSVERLKLRKACSFGERKKKLLFRGVHKEQKNLEIRTKTSQGSEVNSKRNLTKGEPKRNRRF